MLFVDTRWSGQHGIARFAGEVISRLDLRWDDLGATGSPSAGLDAVNVARARLPRRAVVWSPGYNAGITRARQILTLHDTIHLDVPSESNLAKRTYYRWLVRPAIRRAGLVLTVSETSRRALVSWVDDSSVEVVNVGNGVSANFVPDGPEAGEEKPFFLYVGNARPHKNIGVILDALTARPQYRLIAVTSDAEAVREEAQTHGVAGQVKILSGVSDAELASYYRSSDGLLMPSTLEGFGLPAVEALCTGTKVAFWRGCESVAEIVGATGIEVAASDSGAEWAEAMDRLRGTDRVTSPEVQAVRERYSWEQVAYRVQASLEKCEAL